MYKDRYTQEQPENKTQNPLHKKNRKIQNGHQQRESTVQNVQLFQFRWHAKAQVQLHVRTFPERTTSTSQKKNSQLQSI